MQRLAMRIKEANAEGGDVRVLQLKYDAILANASTKPRATDSLFKEACSTDLLFLIDTTGSMMSYIEAAKTQVKSIVSDIKEAFFNEADVRIAVVSYKDHGDNNALQFLDFTPSADTVRSFIDELTAHGGGDAPENVLGGIQQALNASWQQQTRCIIHIADAPPHGHNLNSCAQANDRWHSPGTEPHRLTYEPLLKKMVGLNINYALLRINQTTDKMAHAFLGVYAPFAPECKLHEKNAYYRQACELAETAREKGGGIRRRGRNLQFEEQELGTTYSALRHLVVRNVTTSASRTASRISGASTARESNSLDRSSSGGGRSRRDGSKSSGFKKWGSMQMKSIQEDDAGDEKASPLKEEEEEDEGVTVSVETSPPRWSSPRWLDKTLHVEAYSTTTTANSLDELLDDDTSIHITVADLTVRKRSRPFAQGAQRVASYALTAASTRPLVVKSFKKRDSGKYLAHLADDMRCQALCKAFALEFNSLLLPDTEHAIDFVVTTCLRPKQNPFLTSAGKDECLSLEPFLDGKYIKYNSNSGYVNESVTGPSSEAAQAFSHFTFERSRGRFLVSDLQGVGGILTDPAIHSRDPERFKLLDTNLGEAGFKFFFATHRCNSLCEKLGLKSRANMLGVGAKLEFRETWELQEKGKTTCCTNRMCRRIILGDSASSDEGEWEGSWCATCRPQLESTRSKITCRGGLGVEHEFLASRFYYEARGEALPALCGLHGGYTRLGSGSKASQTEVVEEKIVETAEVEKGEVEKGEVEKGEVAEKNSEDSEESEEKK